MDYYEELGLDSKASTEDIRRAYKRLAMQYHPDRRSTDVQRRWAETQMKRLNQIVETLSNAAERARYDETLLNFAMIELADRQRAEEFFFRRRRRIRTWAAALIAVVCLAGAAFLFSGLNDRQDRVLPRSAEEPEVPETHVSRPPAKATAVQAATPVAQAPPVVRAEAPAAAPRVLPDPEEPPAVPKDPPAAVFAESTGSPAVIAPPAVAARIPPAPAKNALSGTWIFSVFRSAETKLPYAAQYVEVSITALEQRISGRFQGVYNVRSTTLPPRVQFRFEGGEDDLAKGVKWKSDNGAEGLIKFHLLSETELEVGWYTTRFASAPTLTSGNAILTKDPTEH